MVEKQENSIQRTEEVRDIIDRMPHRTGKVVAFVVAILAGFLLFFGFIIKYPESVSGVVTMSARQSPVRLTAPYTGRLHFLAKNNEEIKEGEIIAYIESGTNINDFFFLDSIMKFNPDELVEKVIPKVNQLALGELTITFLKLLNSIEAFNLHKNNNSYIPQLQRMNIQKKGSEKLLGFLDEQLGTQIESKNIQAQNLYKDSLQYFRLKSVNEAEFLQSKTSYLSAVQNLNALRKEKEQTIDLVKDLDSQISLLLIEQKEYEQNLTMNLFANYHELKNQICQWKQKFTFIAPYSGKLEMLNFWKENTYLQMGEEVFAIIPTINPFTAQVLIPSLGAGKVKSGQEVIIKLDDFPYLEFGTITGKVKSISMLTNLSEKFTAQQKIDTYQVIVELPEQLRTNYGSILNLKHDIKGMAEILVKKRKLIERLFDNLKYLANE
jgi:hypothetical protein